MGLEPPEFEVCTPPPLTGGVPHTSPPIRSHSAPSADWRELPEISLSECPKGYAQLAAQGWDTIQEAVALTPSVELLEILKAGRDAAEALSGNSDGMVQIELNGEPFKIHATGAKGGFRYRLENDDFMILIGSPDREWTLSIRYLSAGLWEHGVEALRVRVFDALRPYVRQKDADCVRVSRADWCFDFYSPKFFEEFRPSLLDAIVCPSGVKSQLHGRTAKDAFADKFEVWARRARVQTLTIGSKSGLQNQAYDKTKEIDEASGKTWLYGVWRRGLGYDPWGAERPRDMLRLECRFSADFLKDRNTRRPFELRERAGELIAEALYKRRLCVPTSDTNAGRWPLHPIWSAAYLARGAGEMLPLGRMVTGRRDELVQRARAQIAGGVRALTVLSNKEFVPGSARDHVEAALKIVALDPKHAKKVQQAKDRYSTVEEAR